MTIAEREELVKGAVARLKSIQTLEEYKASKEEITDMFEQIFKSAVDILKYFFENMFSMSQEEQKAIGESVQSDNFLFHPDIMQELDRLENIPGAKEFSESFSAEVQEKMAPYLEEFTEQMGKLMENFMGGLTEGMGAAFSGVSAAGNTGEEQEEEEIGHD
jgi:hypothetical protein